MNIGQRPGLRHRFVAGLRFDTQALFQDGAGRWRELTRPRGSVLAQALALLTGRWPGRLPSASAGLDPIAVMNQRLPGCRIWRREAWQGNRLLRAITLGLNSGGVVLARVEMIDWETLYSRWVLVVGLEEECLGAEARLRALLVRDGMLPEVWACGYNARLELVRNASPLPVMTYRSLDGGLWRARLLEAVGAG